MDDPLLTTSTDPWIFFASAGLGVSSVPWKDTAAFNSASCRHSATDLMTSVTSARIASSDATANAATDWYSLYRISTCSGTVLVCPRMWPDTTDTAPNSPIARALHKITP